MESFTLVLWKTFFISQLLSVHLGNCELQAEAGEVRLVNPRDRKSREGIVKVFLDDDWHWISPDGFDQPTATVICRRAGFSGEAIPDEENYHAPAPPTKTLRCDGEEVTPLDCTIEDIEPEDGHDSLSYSHDIDFWKNYTGAYVICNELDLSQLIVSDTGGSISIAISIVLLVLVVALVILFACLLHRCILRRELAKMTISKPDEKDPNVAPMQYTSLNMEAEPSNQEKPATKETSFVGGDDDTPTASSPTYSSRLYKEHKGGNAGGEEEYVCPDEVKGKKADQDPDNPEDMYVECL